MNNGQWTMDNEQLTIKNKQDESARMVLIHTIVETRFIASHFFNQPNPE